jgi:hypothetical protein
MAVPHMVIVEKKKMTRATNFDFLSMYASFTDMEGFDRRQRSSAQAVQS